MESAYSLHLINASAFLSHVSYQVL